MISKEEYWHMYSETISKASMVEHKKSKSRLLTILEKKCWYIRNKINGALGMQVYISQFLSNTR